MAFRVALVIALCSIAAHLNIVSCDRQPRIVGGQPANIEDFPYMVSVHFLTNGDLNTCGGSLISPNCVLTAAHCVTDVQSVSIRAGSVMKKYGGETTYAENLFIPKNYNRRAISDLDVAIVQLAKPLEGENIATIQLDYSNITRGDTVSVSGWGDMIPGIKESAAEILQTVNLTVTDLLACAKEFAIHDPAVHFTENMFCTYDKGKDSCNGDSGGPVVRNGKQVGIVSFGYYCTFPSVFTRIGSPEVSSFIQSTMREYC